MSTATFPSSRAQHREVRQAHTERKAPARARRCCRTGPTGPRACRAGAPLTQPGGGRAGSPEGGAAAEVAFGKRGWAVSNKLERVNHQMRDERVCPWPHIPQRPSRVPVRNLANLPDSPGHHSLLALPLPQHATHSSSGATVCPRASAPRRQTLSWHTALSSRVLCSPPG